MAQEIQWGENNVVFTEGPFVICNAMGNGWRIEAEMKGQHCPVLPDDSIYELENMFGLKGKTNDKALATKVCDELNQMVRNGQIILDSEYGKAWIHSPMSAAMMATAAVAI